MRSTDELLPLSANPKDAEVTLAGPNSLGDLKQVASITGPQCPQLYAGVGTPSSRPQLWCPQSWGRRLSTLWQDTVVAWAAGIHLIPFVFTVLSYRLHV